MALQQGATIGIIGGGQLGRMLAMAAARLGFRTCILEPGKDCPAAQVANSHFEYAYDDEAGLQALARASDVVTYEFENVPVAAARMLEKQCVLYPPSRALELSQDRLIEKDFLNQCGAKTAGYFNVENIGDLLSALEAFDGSGVLKTRRFGYDGKGQARFNRNSETEIGDIYREFDGTACVLEELIDFEREISVIAARDRSGNFCAYDPAWNVHREGILHTSTIPAGVSQSVADTAIETSHRIMDELSYVGVMATEYFVTCDGSLLVNEIAPRVHNSGHWTEAGCLVSQFEQHIRAIAGWPLGDGLRHSDCVMENLIGAEAESAHLKQENAAAMLHLYGKKESRPGRKMGHFTRVGPMQKNLK